MARIYKILILIIGVGLLLPVTFLLFPAFNASGRPVETINSEVVFSGDGLVASGTLDNVALGEGSSGSDVLKLSLYQPLASGVFLSDPIKADFDFNALGLHWLDDTPGDSSIDAEVMFSIDGSNWSNWEKVSVDDDEAPAHIDSTRSAGETIGQLVFNERARFFQYRLIFNGGSSGETPTVSRLSASYIDSMGYHESRYSPAAIAWQLTSLFKSDTAGAQPAIITRAQWGADDGYTLAHWPPEPQRPKKVILHHTAGSNYIPDPAGTVRGIYSYHAVSLGWGDIGYNYLVDQQGRIYEGRYGGYGTVGGHALGWNNGSVGISVLGNYESATVTSAIYNGVVEISSWVSNVNSIDPWGNDAMNGRILPNYLGHRDVNSTACPGINLYNFLPAIRNDSRIRYSPQSPYVIVGGIRMKWDALGGAPGSPLNNEYPVGGSNGSIVGQAQDFQAGRIIWNLAAERGYWIYGGILIKYDGMGREGSMLGMPKSDEYGVIGGRTQDFDNGVIYWSPGSGSHYIFGDILVRFITGGGVGSFGLPVSDEYNIPGVPGGRQSDFERARIYSTASYGTRAIYGDILSRYLSWGGPQGLGPPTTEEYNIPGVPGARQCDFTLAHILHSPGTGARVSLGAIYLKYLEWGGPDGSFGLPITDEFAGSPGRAQLFEGGAVTWYEPAGTFVIYGAIKDKYMQLWGSGSYQGPALCDETDVAGVPGARMNRFFYGNIYYSAATGPHAVYGDILATYLNRGGPASLGLPVSDEYGMPGVPGGRQSDFQLAGIYYHPYTGAVEVYGAVRSLWLGYGGAAGYFGLPLAAEKDVPGVPGAREAVFERSRIYWSDSSGAHAVYGGVLSAYLGYGGPASALGLPTAEEYSSGSGRRSDFEGGHILWTPANGAQVFTGGEA